MPAQFQLSAISYQSSARKAESRKPARPAGGLTSESSKRGFTLIELMITISIIAVISAIGIISYSQVQKIARDSRRKQDLADITKLLLLYYNDHGKYPASLFAGDYTDGNNRYHYFCSSIGGETFINELITLGYTQKLLVDPINTGGGPWFDDKYEYCYGNAINNGQTYTLTAQLENKADPDRCDVKKWKSPVHGVWCDPPVNFSDYIYEAGPDR